MSESFYEKIYKLAKMIPRGKVATYGQIASLLGSPRSARIVGYALHIMPEDLLKQVPWQRIINREGRISTTCREHSANLQAKILRSEGIKINIKNGQYFIDLKKYLWHP